MVFLWGRDTHRCPTPAEPHTFQLHFLLFLVSPRIVTELAIILIFLCIWRVQRDHRALRQCDVWAHYHLGEKKGVGGTDPLVCWEKVHPDNESEFYY